MDLKVFLHDLYSIFISLFYLFLGVLLSHVVFPPNFYVLTRSLSYCDLVWK